MSRELSETQRALSRSQQTLAKLKDALSRDETVRTETIAYVELYILILTHAHMHRRTNREPCFETKSQPLQMQQRCVPR